ncbi:MAG: hypothetical protein JNM82_03510, partial [Rhodocyclaceae bacterium]|nr:hypothetical protein [Rhodocyclaceae bacterium]
RLSPAYDLVPNLARNLEHVLAMGHGRMTPTGGELVDLGGAWLGSRARAVAAVEAVTGAVADFADVAAKLGVSSRSVEIFAADIGRRLARLRSG